MSKFNPGDQVIVTSHPFKGMKGTVQTEPSTNPERPVHVMLEGAPWSTDHAESHLEKVEA